MIAWIGVVFLIIVGVGFIIGEIQSAGIERSFEWDRQRERFEAPKIQQPTAEQKRERAKKQIEEAVKELGPEIYDVFTEINQRK